MTRPILIATMGALSLLTVGGIFALNPPRMLEMRSSESDFQERMVELEKSQPRPRSAAARQVRRDRDEGAGGDWGVGTAAPREAVSAADDDLSSWYGETNTSVTVPTGVSVAPVDESYLINDTRPFGAPKEKPEDNPDAAAQEAAW